MLNRFKLGSKLTFFLLLGLLASCKNANPQSDELQKQERLLWVNVNIIRKYEADLPELVRDEKADQLAREASCMFLKGKWDKSDSDRKIALGADVSAENYFSESEDVANKAIAAWYRDEKAMRNLLNPVYQKTGIGACKSGLVTFLTQIYYRYSAIGLMEF